MYKFYYTIGYGLTSHIRNTANHLLQWSTADIHLKRWLMRINLIIGLLCAAFLQISFAANGQNITISKKNASITEVFKEIRRQSGYDFVITNAQVKQAKPITIDTKASELKQVLDECFADQPFSYSIQNKTIIVVPKKEESPKPDNNAPPINIKGRVLDSLGNPLPGATIKVKETNAVYITDADGQFNIKNIPNGAILVVSYIGYQTRNIPSSDGGTIEIRLSQSSASLQQVSVVYNGYQSLPAERATGSFAQPDKKMFDGRVSTDVISKLEGITSGLVFNRSVGGSDISKVQIRGESTINADKQVLVVVDNFPYEGDFNNINPNDIASVTVLKDAAAASIWGARAGNGVIVITTKKGQYNQPLKVDFVSNFTLSGKPNLKYDRNFLPSNEIVNLQQDLFNKNYYNGTLNSDSYMRVPTVVEILSQQNTGAISALDAQAKLNVLRQVDVRDGLSKYFYQSQFNQQYSLNLSGGSGFANYNTSIGYDHNIPSLLGNASRRITINSSASFKPTRNLEINGNISYASSQADNNSVYGQLPHLQNYTQFADANGTPLPITTNSFRLSYTSAAASKGFLDWNYIPLLDQPLQDNTSNDRNIILKTGLRYTIIKGLSFEGIYQYQTGRTVARNYYSSDSFYTRNLINTYAQTDGTKVTGWNIPLGGILNYSAIESNAMSGRGSLNFNRSFGEHSISAIAGFEERQIRTETVGNPTLYGYDITTDSYQNVNYGTPYTNNPGGGAATIPTLQGISHAVDRFRSYFSNVSYTYKDRYMLSGSARIDQVNLFGVNTNNKSVPLWSSGIKWDVSKESFYKAKWLPVLDFRGTYGWQGNFIRSGAAYTTVVNIPGGLSNVTPSTTRVLNPGNPDLTWEKTAQLNIAVDFALQNDILAGSIEYYHKDGSDLVGPVPVASSTGFASTIANYANIKGGGIDVNLRSTIVNRAIKWQANLLFSHVNDKVTKYLADAYAQGYRANLLEGKPISSVFANKWAGLSPVNGAPQGYDLNGNISTDYVTLNSYSDGQKDYVGRATPNIYGGLRNTLTYKQFAFSFNLSYKFGYFFSRTSIDYSGLYGGGLGNIDYLNRWQHPGDEKVTNVPSAPTTFPLDPNRDYFYNNSTAVITSGDHIRLQDVILTYDFGQQLSQKLGINKFQISGYMNNLGIIWRKNKYGIDPDTQLGSLNPRTYSLSIKANF